jgi:CRISPR-associated protein Cas2
VTVVVLIAAPEGLRGHLTRWMVEVAAGIFVGTPNQRVRDRLWTTLTDRIGDGQAVMIEPTTTEQRCPPAPPAATAGTPSTSTD